MKLKLLRSCDSHPSNGFEVIDFKIGIIGQYYLQNHDLDKKVLEVWPPPQKKKIGF